MSIGGHTPLGFSWCEDTCVSSPRITETLGWPPFSCAGHLYRSCLHLTGGHADFLLWLCVHVFPLYMRMYVHAHIRLWLLQKIHVNLLINHTPPRKCKQKGLDYSDRGSATQNLRHTQLWLLLLLGFLGTELWKYVFPSPRGTYMLNVLCRSATALLESSVQISLHIRGYFFTSVNF